MADTRSVCKEFKLDTKLSCDILYADDIAIISTVFEKLQLSTEELQATCRIWGMTINLSKFKFITLSDKRFVLESEKLETVGDFCFLGSVVPSTQRYVN